MRTVQKSTEREHGLVCWPQTCPHTFTAEQSCIHCRFCPHGQDEVRTHTPISCIHVSKGDGASPSVHLVLELTLLWHCTWVCCVYWTPDYTSVSSIKFCSTVTIPCSFLAIQVRADLDAYPSPEMYYTSKHLLSTGQVTSNLLLWQYELDYTKLSWPHRDKSYQDIEQIARLTHSVFLKICNWKVIIVSTVK